MEIEILSGFLFTKAKSSNSPSWDDLISCNDILPIDTNLHSNSSWRFFIINSDIPLQKEDVPNERNIFEYPLVVRKSGEKVILLSYTRKIVDHCINNIFPRTFSKFARFLPIEINSLVKHLAYNPNRYVISFVHARVQAYGEALRAVSFYGDDVAEVPLFRENLGFFSCYTCGLRDVTGGGELIRLGNDGYISFNYAKSDHGKKIDLVLSYISSLGFLTSRSGGEF